MTNSTAATSTAPITSIAWTKAQLTTALKSLDSKTDSALLSNLVLNSAYHALIKGNLNISAMVKMLDGNNAALSLNLGLQKYTMKAALLAVMPMVKGKDGTMTYCAQKAKLKLTNLNKKVPDSKLAFQSASFEDFANLLELNYPLLTPKVKKPAEFKAHNFSGLVKKNNELTKTQAQANYAAILLAAANMLKDIESRDTIAVTVDGDIDTTKATANTI